MKQERMKILELLDQGKISATEAANLLEALKASDSQERLWDESTRKSVQEKVNKFTQNVESVSKDVGDKLESAFKDMEPKLRSVTKVVVEKTASIVDEISKSLNETIKNLEEKRGKEEACCEEVKKEACCAEEKKEACCAEAKEKAECQVKPESGDCCHEEKAEEKPAEPEDKPVEN